VVNGRRRDRVKYSSGWSRRRRVKVKVNARWCCGGVCKNEMQVLVRLQEEAVVQEASEGTIDFVVAGPGRDGGIICLPRTTSGDGVDWTSGLRLGYEDAGRDT
jgi:hypothetical protein